MKMSGNSNELFLFFDPKIVPNGDVENYLTRVSNGQVVTVSNSIENQRFNRIFGTNNQNNS